MTAPALPEVRRLKWHEINDACDHPMLLGFDVDARGAAAAPSKVGWCVCCGMFMQVYGAGREQRVVHMAPSGAERYATHVYPRCRRCGAIEIPRRLAADAEHPCNCHLEHQPEPA